MANILCFSAVDTAGQNQLLTKYFRDQDPDLHKVKHIAASANYLNYPCDLNLHHEDKENGQFDYDLLSEFKNHDFYFLRITNPARIVEMIKQGYPLNKNNTIIRLHGTDLREGYEAWNFLYKKMGFLCVVNGHDFSMCRNASFTVQHIPLMINWRYLRQMSEIHQSRDARVELTVAHAPTVAEKKGTALLQAAVDRLRQNNIPIKLDLITNVSWDEAIRRKAGATVLFDQISQNVNIHTFGLNLIEGLAQGKICFGGYNRYTYSMYPELSKYVINVQNQRDIEMELINCQSSDMHRRLLDEQVLYAQRFDYSVVGKRMEYLMNFARLDYK